jgi:hypothetical protein
MMKKTLLLISVLALMAPALFAAPSDEDVTASMEAAMAAYGASVLASMMGTPYPGVEMTQDNTAGTSTVVFDNLDVAALFVEYGNILDGTEDLPEVPFSRMSGFLKVGSQGSMELDISMTGGPVKKLHMMIDGENVSTLDADGKNYLYITRPPGTN